MADLHVFEKRGLGTAPYIFLGAEVKVGPIVIRNAGGTETHIGSPGQPMGSCDYCGTACSTEYRLRSQDGRTFKVGCECIKRAGDAGLKKAIAPVLREQARVKRAAKAEATREALAALLDHPALANQPHPHAYRAANGATLADYADWMLKNAGDKGRADTLALVTRAIAPKS